MNIAAALLTRVECSGRRCGAERLADGTLRRVPRAAAGAGLPEQPQPPRRRRAVPLAQGRLAEVGDVPGVPGDRRQLHRHVRVCKRYEKFTAQKHFKVDVLSVQLWSCNKARRWPMYFPIRRSLPARLEPDNTFWTYSCLLYTSPSPRD